jgi:hypothetical protein
MLCVAVAMLAVPSVARAQAKEGDKEIKIGGSLFSIVSSGSTFTTGQFDFGVGYFVSDRFEITVAPRITVSSGAGSSVDVDGGVSFQGQYFFGAQSSMVKPYIGVTEIVESFKTSGGGFKDNLYTGAIFGVKNYFTERAALDVNAQYGFRTSAPADYQLLSVTVGITYLF